MKDCPVCRNTITEYPVGIFQCSCGYGEVNYTLKTPIEPKVMELESKIHKLYSECLYTAPKEPNALFLGREEFRNFKLIEFLRYSNTSIYEARYMGMKIVELAAPTGLMVGYVEVE